MKTDIGNLFESIPESIQDEVVTEFARTKHVKIARIVSPCLMPPTSDWYDQSENEWVIVLEGEAKIVFDNNEEIHLKAGGYVDIPAHKRHKVTWTSPHTQTIWLAIHYQ